MCRQLDAGSAAPPASTQDTLRVWTPLPQAAEQDDHAEALHFAAQPLSS